MGCKITCTILHTIVCFYGTNKRHIERLKLIHLFGLRVLLMFYWMCVRLVFDFCFSFVLSLSLSAVLVWVNWANGAIYMCVYVVSGSAVAIFNFCWNFFHVTHGDHHEAWEKCHINHICSIRQSRWNFFVRLCTHYTAYIKCTVQTHTQTHNSNSGGIQQSLIETNSR